jgi:hypothetical protein
MGSLQVGSNYVMIVLFGWIILLVRRCLWPGGCGEFVDAVCFILYIYSLFSRKKVTQFKQKIRGAAKVNKKYQRTLMYF